MTGIDIPIDDFLIRAGLAGIGTALVAGPLGCFVVWRRMAYFGDATAHAALLGVALALALALPVFAGVLVVALAIAFGTAFAVAGRYGADTILGVFAHAGLAFGLLALSFLEGVRIDLMGYLFGDILAVNGYDLALIWGGGAAALAALVLRWRQMLNSTLNPELALAEGGRPDLDRLLLTVLLAFLVAIAMKIVGVLLITALLIVPAAAARPLARTPETMALWAALIGVGAVLGGLPGAFALDTPTGPTIAATAVLIFALTNIAGLCLAKWHRALPR